MAKNKQTNLIASVKMLNIGFTTNILKTQERVNHNPVGSDYFT